MRCYWSIVVLCGLACVSILSTGCKPNPDPTIWSTTGDIEVGEITFSPDPVGVNQNTSVSFELSNVGATNVRPIDAHIVIVGPICPGVNAGTCDENNIELRAGSSTTVTLRGWRPNQKGSFRVRGWASIGNDTDPSNNEMSIIGNVGDWNPFNVEPSTPTPPAPVVYVPYDDGKFIVNPKIELPGGRQVQIRRR